MLKPKRPSNLTYNDLNGSEALDILTDWFRQLLSAQPLLQPHLTLPQAVMRLNIGVEIEMYNGGTVPVGSPPDTVAIGGTVTLKNTLSTVVSTAPLAGGQPPDQVRERHDLPVSRPGYGPRDVGAHLFLADIATETDRRHADVARRMGSGSQPAGDAHNPLLSTPPDAPPPVSVRQGIVADGYTFAEEQPSGPVLEQSIPLANGAIDIDLAGRGISHAGMTIKDDSHRRSVKDFGDQKGERYSSVNGVMDAGPAGLMNRRGGGGLGSDGRQRLSFGNNNRG